MRGPASVSEELGCRHTPPPDCSISNSGVGVRYLAARDDQLVRVTHSVVNWGSPPSLGLLDIAHLDPGLRRLIEVFGDQGPVPEVLKLECVRLDAEGSVG
jgi:hypothetical protein